MVAQINKKMFSSRKSKVVGRIFSWLFVEGRPLTTKGRWINSLVFFLYRIYELFPERDDASSPVYIIGTGRSGTTILGSLFAMHKDAVFLNEPKAVWHHIFKNEDIVGNYTLNKGQIRLNENAINEKVRKSILRIYSVALRIGLAKKVVDKYPELIYRVPFVLKLLPAAKFILIIRNGIDTCSSVANWSSKNKAFSKDYKDDWWGRNDRKWRMLVKQLVPEHQDLLPIQHKLMKADNHVDRAALEWILAMREGQKIVKEYKEVMVVRYEELCGNIDENIKKITKHCALESDLVVNEYANSILKVTEPYKPIALMPELIVPFKETLTATGYEECVTMVEPRE